MTVGIPEIRKKYLKKMSKMVNQNKAKCIVYADMLFPFRRLMLFMFITMHFQQFYHGYQTYLGEKHKQL
jgi:hypothetical protein